MKVLQKGKIIPKINKKTLASHAKIDYNLRDIDVVVIGGIHAASTIKYLQYTDFHGSIAGFSSKQNFFNEHHYEYLIHGNMKPFKYSSNSFLSNFDPSQSIGLQHKIVDINPKEQWVLDSTGSKYNYKVLVLNTGLDQSVDNMPFVKKYVEDGEFAESRVFVHNPSNPAFHDRNRRIFVNHKDNDYLVYLPEYPSRREAYDAWYLALDQYYSWGVQSCGYPQNMKVRIITPNKDLFKFPFANEVVMDEVSKRQTLETHFGWELVNIEIEEKHVNATKRYATFKCKETGKEMRLQFGSLLLTPNNKKRECYESNDITDKDGLVTVNPYTLQHTKYHNIFAFGDCANLNTTKSFYATLNQNITLRTNLQDYLNGREFKGVYEGYSSFGVNHCIDRQWVFSHYYNYVPSFGNFWVPRFLGLFVYCIKNTLEKQFFNKVFQAKPNYGWPYLVKDRYFRPVDENKFVRKNNISKQDLFKHAIQPSLVKDH